MPPRRTPRLSLDLLRSFHAAARHLSFTRAAQELHLTQPAISRGIRTLEDQLGVDLFRRVNRRLSLSAEGQRLFQAADEALRLIDAAALDVSGGPLTLAVTTTVALASTWLVPLLPQFTRAHPELDLRLVASNDLLDLEREQLDVALRFVPRWMPPPAGEKLFDYQQFPVCAPSLLADAGRALRTAEDLAQHVLIDFETTLYGRPWSDWQQWFDAMGRRERAAAGSLRFSHYDQVIDAAVRGLGVAVGKRPHLSEHLRRGTLVAPLGAAGCATVGAFHVELAPGGSREAVEPFVRWVREAWAAAQGGP